MKWKWSRKVLSHHLLLMNFIINSIVTSSLVVVIHGTLEIMKKTNFNISLSGKNYVINWGIFYYQLEQVLLPNWGNFILLQIGASVITNSGSFILLQIGESVITNWGSLIITNQGKLYYKSGQLLQVREPLLQFGAVITYWGKFYYKIRAVITNCDNYYKLAHNNYNCFWI